MHLTKLHLRLYFFVVFVVVFINSSSVFSQISIVPKPVKMELGSGEFVLTPKTIIVVKSPELKNVGDYLSALLTPSTGMKLLTKTDGKGKSCIILAIDKSKKELGDEGYILKSNANEMVITAVKPAGVFYGIQTLRQLLPEQIEHTSKVENILWSIPAVNIEDIPRFKWRGYLLDVSRHFRTKKEILRYIDLLAFQKLNTLQLHLVDDQGWRIEIKKYPKLVEIGSRLPDHSGNKSNGWFYSQDDIREIVSYAASRFINVVPEIEMPGHSLAITTAYPELGCDGRPSHELCVSREGTFAFMTNVLDEVMALFPSLYIHVGADEVRPERWRACSKCGKQMAGLAKIPLPPDVATFRVPVKTGAGRPFHEDIGRLQGEYIRKIDEYISSKGRKMIGWDEILEGGIKKNSKAVVTAWRSKDVVAGSTGMGHEVIVSVYPDYYLDITDISLERTYQYDPLPDNLPEDHEKYVIGAQGNMWGEATPTIQVVDSRSFPRITAIAEITWTPLKDRNYEDFSKRLGPFLRRLDQLGVHIK